jgi:hypothetical protein
LVSATFGPVFESIGSHSILLRSLPFGRIFRSSSSILETSPQSKLGSGVSNALYFSPPKLVKACTARGSLQKDAPAANNFLDDITSSPANGCVKATKNRLDSMAIGIPLAIIHADKQLIPSYRRTAMQVELFCPRCSCSFAAPPDTPAVEILDRMADDGPWYALGDGETFEDMIFSTFLACGAIRCSECGEPAFVSEQSLGQLTLEVLGSW